MSYYLLPEIHTNIDKLQFQSSQEDNLYVSFTLNNYLNNIKKQIDENYENWDYMKRYTNPHEFIHTIVQCETNI